MGRKSMAATRRQEIIAAFYHCVNAEGMTSASIRKIARHKRQVPHQQANLPFLLFQALLKHLVVAVERLLFADFGHVGKDLPGPIELVEHLAYRSARRLWNVEEEQGFLARLVSEYCHYLSKSGNLFCTIQWGHQIRTMGKLVFSG